MNSQIASPHFSYNNSASSFSITNNLLNHESENSFIFNFSKTQSVNNCLDYSNRFGMKFVSLNIDILVNGPQFFLIDCAADISIIKKSVINPMAVCLPNIKHTVQGITNENIKTQAAINSKIIFPNSTKLNQTFHIVDDNFPIQCAGILGKDFLIYYKTILNFENMTLRLVINNFDFILDLCSNSVDQQFEINPRVEKKMQLPFSAVDNVEYFCPAQEISKGVFLASSIVTSKNNTASFMILNINDHPVVLNSKLKIRSEPLSNFSVFNLISWNNITSDRLTKLESEINFDNLNCDEQTSILKICREFNDIFYLSGDKLTTTNAIQHNINLIPHSKIVHKKPYRFPEAVKPTVEKHINELLENNIIEPSISPWNSPLLIVPKKSDSDEKKWRIVIDYRKLNEITINDVFPLPNINEILDQLGKANYFSTLDLANGFYQVKLNPNDKIKTAFSTNSGHYHFNCMPMGTKNSPSTFQRLMTHVLSGIQGIKSFVYLDDIVVYGSTLHDHNQNLISVFSRLRKYNLKLNPSKCTFLQKEIRYLGHIITNSGVRPNPGLIDAIIKYPTPKSVKEVVSFLGLAGFYRQFINNFAKIAEPLSSLKNKKIIFRWDGITDEAFNKLKKALINPPILQYPDFSKKFYLTTDASDKAIGAILSQVHNNQDLPIAYASRVLNSAEKNYATIKKELLAIIWATRKFRPYLYGKLFTIVTDHKPLTFLHKTSNPNSMLLRWRLELEEYNYDIQYKPGKINKNADALSRIEIDSLSEDKILAITRSKSKQSGILQPNLNQSNPTPTVYNPSQNINQTNFSQDNTNLNQSNPTETKTQTISNSNQKNHNIITNENQIEQIIEQFHINPMGGHQGIVRTFKRIKSYYVFPKMLSKIRKFINKCKDCQKNKIFRKIKCPMKITSTSKVPFQKVFLDIVGPINPISYAGNKYILTMQDDLTKFTIATVLPNQEAKTIARAFAEDFILKFGCPEEIQTDQGTNFMSQLMKNLCKFLKISKLNSTAYHPQSQGALERFHRTLGEYLRNYCNQDPMNWDSWIPFAVFSYNSTPHSQTTFMPFELIFGFKPSLPNSIQKYPDPPYNFEDYCTELKYRLQISWNIAKEHLLKNKKNSKLLYDSNTFTEKFEEGDEVFLENEAGSSKTKPLRDGPYKVVKKLSSENSIVKIGKKLVTVHNNRLRLFKK